ncbi:MAG: beta-galactosidase [Cyclobacteriaceae bacterium]|nr:beta-galactosidase [Cyclobacteriaceae bacterium HetDA_MAG_MS6]
MKIWLCSLLFSTGLLQAQVSTVPSVGAQVFIEPGQSKEQIFRWFEILSQNRFTSCRIRMFESYMVNGQGELDFTLFDWAFEAAKKYDIHVFATIFPEVPFENVGGIKLPDDDNQLSRISDYIRELVLHFKGHPALAAWVLINEPGLGYLPNTPFANQRFKAYKDSIGSIPDGLHHYRQADLSKNQFLLELNTWFLKWIATEIKKLDTETPTHVNNHQLFSLVDEYDFPRWMPFLSSLGASIHPSWHFRFFDRKDYPMAVAANCDLIRTSALGKPYWVTELQGGANTFSGYNPVSPTDEELAQWLWLTIFSGAEGTIFWSLNPRSVGIEAGEWSLLNYNGAATDRLGQVSKIANIMLEDHFFETGRPLKENIQILYTHESIWAEKYLHVTQSPYEARNWGASMKSTLGYYKALTSIGIPVKYGEIGTVNWVDPPKVIILPNQLSVSDQDWENLEQYARNGGQLLITGMSGQFDENLFNRWLDTSRYVGFLGGELLEHRLVENVFEVSIESKKLPAHLFKGILSSGNDFATHSLGKGRVTWVPSLLGLGAWLHDPKPLAKWIREVIPSDKNIPSIRHDGHLVMKWMESENQLLGIFINTAEEQSTVQIDRDIGRSKVLYGENIIQDNGFVLLPNQMLILKWEKE